MLFQVLDPTAEEVEQGQSLAGRLTDLFVVWRAAARAVQGDRMTFEMVVARGAEGRQETLTVKSVIGPGDDPAPVITMMLSDED